MNLLKLIIENGFSREIFDLSGIEGQKNLSLEVTKQWKECDDIDTLKSFAKIMADEIHIVDVEPKMVEIMGDEYFDFIDA